MSEFGMLEKLRIGSIGRPSYQEDRFRPAVVKKMIREFNPAQLGVPEVNIRGGNEGTWCFDGNHRIAALLELFGPDYELTVMVHRGLSISQEVALFLDRANRTRRVTAYERFMVRYRSGATVEKDIVRIVQNAGFDVGPSGGGHTNQISSVNILETIYGGADKERYGRMPGASPELLDRTARIAAAIWPDHSGRIGQFLAGLAVLLANRGDDIREEELIRKVQAAGSVHFILGQTKGFSSHGSAIHVANYLLELYNYKRRTRRVEPIELAYRDH